MKQYNSVINSIFDFCIKSNVNFVFISGNGGSGKSTFSKNLKKRFEENGLVANLVDTDDFITNTIVRKSAVANFINSVGEESKKSYSSSFVESYCLNSLNATIFNLQNKLDFYIVPKHAKDNSEYELLKGKANVHIFEGVGTQFLNKIPNSLFVYINCDLELEAKRRIHRARNGEKEKTFKEVLESCKERREQLKVHSLLDSSKFDLCLKSNSDFSFEVNKDVFNVLGGDIVNRDCDFAIKTIKQATNMLVNEFEVMQKGDSDVVTSMELNIEKFIIKKVKEQYPNFNIISEEISPNEKLSDNCVIINGIDGSVNVSKQMPIFGIQMAIIRGGINTAAVTYLPFLNELYFCDETTSYLNGKKINVVSCPVERGLIAATGTERIKKIVALKEHGLILRDYGSIAVAFAWVASGKINGAIYNGDKIWNYYPVLKICEKANALIVNKKGVHLAASDNNFLNIMLK